MASVVIHRYLKVSTKNVAISKAHIRYIQHRSGEDRERNPADESSKLRRELFDAERESVNRRELNALIDREPPGGVAIHKLTLSPGVQGIDLKEYTREIMDELGREKGLDLRWAAAAHRNTDHDHVHVVILGSDANGRRVRLDRGDHNLLRDKSDRYLEREHSLDRDRDQEKMREAKLLREEAFEREGLEARLGRLFGKQDQPDREVLNPPSGWSKERALEQLPEWQKINVQDRTYTKFDSKEDLKQLDEHLKTNFDDRISKREYAMMHRWIDAKERHGDSCFEQWDEKAFEKKKEEREAQDAHREWHELDKNARKFLEQQEFVLHRTMPHQQLIYEQRGRLTEFHCTYQNSMAKQELENAKARFQDPIIQDYIERELAWRLEYQQEELKNLPTIDLDSLFGRNVDRDDRNHLSERETGVVENLRDTGEEKDHNRGQESLVSNEKPLDLELTAALENKPQEEHQTTAVEEPSRELTDAQHGQEMHERSILEPNLGEDEREERDPDPDERMR